MSKSNERVRKFCRSHLLLTAAASVLCPAVLAFAGSDSWSAGDGNWSEADNWSPANVPEAGDDVDIEFADGVNRTINYDYTGAPVTLNSLTLDLTNFSGTTSSVLSISANNLTANTEYVGDSGSGIVVQTSGTNSSVALDLGYNIGATGTYNLSGGVVTGGNEQFGTSGTGAFNQTGGTNTINGGYSLYLGYNTGATGTYMLSGSGSLSVAGYEIVGGGLEVSSNSGSTGNFNQTGGTNAINGELELGGNSGSTGTYSLSGTGSVTCNDNEMVGIAGMGNLIQYGGTNTINSSLYLGLFNGGVGTYILGGTGSLNDDGDEQVGIKGIGAFIQTGGTNTITGGNSLYLGEFSGLTGTYSLSGTGSLTATQEFIGYGGTGGFVQSGGTNSINDGGISLGLCLGDFIGSVGTYSLSGTGSLSVTGFEYVGFGGSGSFVQTGGTNTTNGGYSLYLGYNSGVNGTYNLSGTGSLSVTGSEYIGYSGTGGFVQTGGTNNASNLTIGNSPTSFGKYTLSGGTLDVANALTITGANSAFIATGGTAIVDSVTTGGSVSIGVTANSSGNLTVNGTYTQTAGSTIVTGTLAASDGIFVNGGTFQIGANGVGGSVSGAIQNNAALLIQGGMSGAPSLSDNINGSGTLTVGMAQTPAYLRIAAGSGVSQQEYLTILPGSTLDITNTTFVVNYGNSIDPANTIRTYLQSACNGGVWTGTGLTSSTVEAQVAATITAHSGGVYGIGYVDGGVDRNQAAKAVVRAVGNQIVYAPALIGDANLDGSVTFIDLGIVAQNLGAINTDWQHGDFNYDGTTNFLDIGLLAQNLSKTVLNTPLDEIIADPSAALTAQWNLAVAEIGDNEIEPANLPEPEMIGALTIGAGVLLLRRRRPLRGVLFPLRPM
jgi:hypothetical protein